MVKTHYQTVKVAYIWGDENSSIPSRTRTRTCSDEVTAGHPAPAASTLSWVCLLSGSRPSFYIMSLETFQSPAEGQRVQSHIRGLFETRLLAVAATGHVGWTGLTGSRRRREPHTAKRDPGGKLPGTARWRSVVVCPTVPQSHPEVVSQATTSALWGQHNWLLYGTSSKSQHVTSQWIYEHSSAAGQT